MPTSARPLTSHQARRAYQKKAVQHSLSEEQIRQINRGAELQERANRIKQKELNRKANVKKKQEKLEREREARARMGIPEPVHEEVESSQTRLGAFVIAGAGRKANCQQSYKPPISRTLNQQSEKEISPKKVASASLQDAKSTRQPLEPRCGNIVVESPSRTPPKSKLKAKPVDNPMPLPPKVPTTLTQHGRGVTSVPSSNDQENTGKGQKKSSTRPPSAKARPKPALQAPEISLMPPPPQPLPKPSSKVLSKPFTKPTINAPPKAPPIVDEWAAFLVSNTQIERELSTPEATPPSNHQPQTKNITITTASSLLLAPLDSSPPAAPVAQTASPPSMTKAEDLLGDTLAKPLPSAANRPAYPTAKRKFEDDQEQDPYFSDEITDRDLEGAVLEAEQQITPQAAPCIQSEGQVEDFFDMIPTQDFRDLVDCI